VSAFTDTLPFESFLSHIFHPRPLFTCYVTPPAVSSILIPHFQRPKATSPSEFLLGPAQKADNTQC
jgi:hypothetical protein